MSTTPLRIRIDRVLERDPPLGLRRDDERAALVSRIPGMGSALMWTRTDGLSVLAMVESDGRLHVSIAHPSRYPSWEEIIAVRTWAFHEDIEVVMVLARKGEYVNLHPNCFHLWQSKCGREGGAGL